MGKAVACIHPFCLLFITVAASFSARLVSPDSLLIRAAFIANAETMLIMFQQTFPRYPYLDVQSLRPLRKFR